MIDGERTPVDGVVDLGTFGRAELAALGREYLLCGHLIDRAGMAYLIGPHGLEGMRDVAIDEWMGASPVYTERMRQLLGFDGDDVASIFKGMQFDIGAPHRFLDFRFTVHDDHHGEFRLDHCGALMDVEPMGGEFVVAMCHDIEDPTFDATAMATNPRAQVRPIHRPPRSSLGDHPHCAWTVDIDPDREPILETATTRAMRSTRAASLPVRTPAPTAPEDGRSDYRGAFVDRIALEEFSAVALLAIIDEFCLQQHLLAMSFLRAVGARWGDDEARRVGGHQLVGIAGLTAQRLSDELDRLGRHGATPTGRIARVLRLHPLLRPAAYVATDIDTDATSVTVSLVDSPALDEATMSWLRLLPENVAPLDAIALAVDPSARAQQVAAATGAAATWRIEVGGEERPEPDEVAVTRLSTGAAWRFDDSSEAATATAVELSGRTPR